MRRTFALLALASVAALASCGEGSTTPSVEPIEGTYTLRTINGTPMPVNQGGTFDVTIMSGVIELGTDGAYADYRTIRWTFNNGVSYQENSIGGGGPWKRSGNVVHFLTGDSFKDYEGTYANGTLTVNVPGELRVYSR